MAHRTELLLAAALTFGVAGCLRAADPVPSAGQVEFFEKRIRPLLADSDKDVRAAAVEAQGSSTSISPSRIAQRTSAAMSPRPSLAISRLR